MKRPKVLIKDASKGRFRVSVIGKNGEPLMNSEVLNTPRAVIKNICAVADAFSFDETLPFSRTIEQLHQLNKLYFAKIVYTGKRKCVFTQFK